MIGPVKFFQFRKPRKWIVAIEWAGSLEGPYSHQATNPEKFAVLAPSARVARRRARHEWADKYDASPRLITAATVETEE